MVNQSCLNIISIKKKKKKNQILKAKFGSKCLRTINFVEEFKDTSNLMKNSAQTDNRKEPYLSDLPDP